MNDGKQCLACNKGTYRDMQIANSADLNNSGLGLRLVGTLTWSAVLCDQCGNVQMFRKAADR